jgi:hypothetical protein
VDRSQRRILTSAVTLVLLGVSLLVNIISRTIDQKLVLIFPFLFAYHTTRVSVALLTTAEIRSVLKDSLTCQLKSNNRWWIRTTLCSTATATNSHSKSRKMSVPPLSLCADSTLFFQDSYCQKYYKQTLSASLFRSTTLSHLLLLPHCLALSLPTVSYFAAFIVLLTNYGIDAYLARSAQYEKHHSLDSQEKSIFLRMLLLKLINTGLSFPFALPYPPHHPSSHLLSGALFLFASFFGQINSLVGVSTPSTGDFTTSWYQTVGVGIVLVQIGDIASPHLTKVPPYPRLLSHCSLQPLLPPLRSLPSLSYISLASCPIALSLSPTTQTKESCRVGSNKRSADSRGTQ